MRRVAFAVALVVPLLVPAASQAASRPARADLVVKSVGTSLAGSTITVTAKIANTGTKSAKASALRLQLSNSITLGTVHVPALAVHKTKTISAHASIPTSIAGGTYTVLACADATHQVKERNEHNDCHSSGPITIAGPSVKQTTPTPAPTPAATPTPTPTGFTGPAPTVVDALTKSLRFLQPYDPAGPDTISASTQTLTYGDTSTTKVIGAAGGALEFTDAAADQMTLTVPAGALLSDTTITATPIASSTLGGTAIGARFEPSGLVFAKAATLSIVPHTGGTAQAAAPFLSNDDGTGVVLGSILPDPTAITVLVDHFTEIQIQVNFGDGITGALNLNDYENWIGGQERAAIIQARDDALPDGQPDLSAFTALLDQQYNQEIAPLLQAAAGDCDVYRGDFHRALTWGHNAGILGAAADSRTAAITTALGAALENCWQDDVAQCQTMWTFPTSLADLRQLAILGSAHTTDELHWCHPLNGVVTVGSDSVTTSSYPSLTIGSDLTWTATYLVSTDAVRSGNGIYTTSPGTAMGTVSATYSYHYTNTSSYPCERKGTGSGQLGPAPTSYQVYFAIPGPGTWSQQYGPYFSFPVSPPQFKLPWSGSDSCFHESFDPIPVYYTADISGAYPTPAYFLTVSNDGQISGHAELSRSTNNGTDQYADTVDVKMTMNGYSVTPQ